MDNKQNDILKNIFSKKLMVSFFMGISSGLPILIVITLMMAWSKDVGISIKKIGLMSLVTMPYTLKFLWAPLFDRFSLPFLGRRRGWLLVTQILTMAAIVFMGMNDPAKNATLFVIAAIFVAFFSASQDIIIDAFRREDLSDEELGIGSSYYVYGYRIGMLAVSGGAMILSDHISWFQVYLVMALCMLPGIVTTLCISEPALEETPPRNFKESVIDPFVAFFKVDGAIMILLFILLYKVGDNMAGALTTPFYLDIGFTKTEIGTVAKLFGFWGTIFGAFVGGAIILKTGIYKALWFFGFLQMISTAGFAIMASVGHNLSLMGAVVAFENISAGMGTAAFLAFMAKLTNKKYTATQYALLTSFMGIPRTFMSSVTGFMVESMGWVSFFTFCTLIAIPGMLLLFRMIPKAKKI